MDKKYLSELFSACLEADYIQAKNGCSLSAVRDGDVLYIFFEKSNGLEDWYNNLSYRAVSRGRDGDEWLCHEGFLRAFEGGLPYLKGRIASRSVRRIVTVGYSHGAALSLLCHEYIWYTRADIRENIEGYGFGCPRVVFGSAKGERERWKNFFVIKNIDDLITHLPPSAFGYRHKGNFFVIGKRGKYSSIDAHRPENYTFELEN